MSRGSVEEVALTETHIWGTRSPSAFTRPRRSRTGSGGPDDKTALAPDAKRSAVGYLVTEYEMPVWRACNRVGLGRSAYYRPPRHWTGRDAEVIAALAELVEGGGWAKGA